MLAGFAEGNVAWGAYGVDWEDERQASVPLMLSEKHYIGSTEYTPLYFISFPSVRSVFFFSPRCH
jgi:hypothetical protein